MIRHKFGASFLTGPSLLLSLASFLHASPVSGKDDYAQGMRNALAGRFNEAKRVFVVGLSTDYPFNTLLAASISIIEDLQKLKIKRKTALLLFKGFAHGNKGRVQGGNGPFHFYALAEAFENPWLCNKTLELNPKYPEVFYNRSFCMPKSDC